MRKWFLIFLKTVAVVAIVAAAGALLFYMRPIWVAHEIEGIRLTASGVRTHNVKIDGHTIHYEVWGPQSGPPIVLVHGLGGRSQDWIYLAPMLVQAGYRVYTPDLLGYGKSDQPQDATYSVPEEAGVVEGFLDAMHLTQTDLAGWSMGGWVVQRVAFDHPERIRRLVIFDSVGLAVAPTWDTRLFTPANAAEVDRLDALLMPQPPVLPQFVTRDILRISAKNGWVIKRAVASMLTGKDVTDTQLPALKMPVLILWGDQDRVTPLSEGRAMHKLIPQSTLGIAPGCGHLGPEQCASMFGPAMVNFLTASSPPTGGEVTLEDN